MYRWGGEPFARLSEDPVCPRFPLLYKSHITYYYYVILLDGIVLLLFNVLLVITHTHIYTQSTHTVAYLIQGYLHSPTVITSTHIIIDH